VSAFFALYKRPEWQKKRLEVMQEASFRCQECSATNDTLNVHHRFYRNKAKPWEYENHELACLCEPCHKEYTESIAEIKKQIGYLDLADLRKMKDELSKIVPDSLVESNNKSSFLDIENKLLSIIAVNASFTEFAIGFIPLKYLKSKWHRNLYSSLLLFWEKKQRQPSIGELYGMADSVREPGGFPNTESDRAVDRLVAVGDRLTDPLYKILKVADLFRQREEYSQNQEKEFARKLNENFV
jgi:hypothetical protein